MPFANAKSTSASPGAKFACGAGWVVLPGAFGHTVSGFMAFSAVMLLKCLSRMARSVPASDPASMAAPTG